MTNYATRSCECKVTTGTGGKRPKECEHGHRFWTEAQLASPKPRAPLAAVSPKRAAEEEAGTPPKSRGGSRRSEPERDWDDAHEKVAEEGCCRICKRTDRKLEAAHVLGRVYDEPKLGAGGQPLKKLYVDPDRIIPACGPFPAGCHGDVDMKRVDLLPVLTLAEQVRAVKDAGGIQHARTLLAPVENREEVAAAAFSEVAA